MYFVLKSMYFGNAQIMMVCGHGRLITVCKHHRDLTIFARKHLHHSNSTRLSESRLSDKGSFAASTQIGLYVCISSHHTPFLLNTQKHQQPAFTIYRQVRVGTVSLHMWKESAYPVLTDQQCHNHGSSGLCTVW